VPMSLNLNDEFRTILSGSRRGKGLPAKAEVHLQTTDGKWQVRTPPGWQKVREHPFFGALAKARRVGLPDAFLSYVRAVSESLDPLDCLLVDWVWALGVHSEHYPPKLEDRRLKLYKQWHEQADTGQARKISESTFRQKEEEEALERFAVALDSPTAGILEKLEVEVDSVAFSYLTGADPLARRRTTSASVVVIGAAVMDFLFRIPRVPESDGSEQAQSFEVHPGGKGLTQAVACRRLDMHTSLIAAIGDDQFGKDIEEYLKDREKVDTSLIRVVHGEATPVTAVITPSSTGLSFAIGWRNESKVSLRPDDLNRADCRSAITTADIVLISLEPPLDTVEAAIDLAHSANVPVILTPAPPPESGQFMKPKPMRGINYLVANQWEFNKFILQETQSGVFDVEQSVERLLLHGVQHVFLTDNGRCQGWGRTPKKEYKVPAWETLHHESAGERDAFCAMLARQLIDNGLQFSERAIFFATAAMAWAGGESGVPNSMPTLKDVTDLIDNGRITVPSE